MAKKKFEIMSHSAAWEQDGSAMYNHRIAVDRWEQGRKKGDQILSFTRVVKFGTTAANIKCAVWRRPIVPLA